jgi:hypothetical protein
VTATIASEVLDAATFRSVFASPEETVILVIVDPHQAGGLREIVEAIGKLRRDGALLKLVVFGGSSALLSGMDATGISFLECWARPLLSAVLEIVDEVIAWGGLSEQVLSDHKEARRKVPIIHRAEVSGDIPSLCRMLEENLALKPLRHRILPSPEPRTLGNFVLQNDWGIGDELLLSAVAREILRAHPGAGIWIRSRFGFRFPQYVRQDPIPPDARAIETIYQNLTLYGPVAHSPFPRHLVQQMLDKFSLDTGLKVKAVDVRPEVELVSGPHERRMDRTVVLNSRPNPRLPSKDWGIERWVRLTELLNAAGLKIRQVGGKEETLLPEVEDLRGVSIRELPDVLARSATVVTVVGLLMHVAEATRTPAVVIYGGREHPAIDGYADQIHLSAGPLPCRGRWGCYLAPDLQCPHGMKCMDHLTPELVAGEVLSLLSQGCVP